MKAGNPSRKTQGNNTSSQLVPPKPVESHDNPNIISVLNPETFVNLEKCFSCQRSPYVHWKGKKEDIIAFPILQRLLERQM